MNYIHITKENLDKEHICCAMSGKQSLAKKEWLRQRFDEGLVFYRSEERGKCFIEYIPAENAWVPIEAAGYLYINCLWIAGAMKGHGYSTDLLNECIRDARAQEKNGVCILCAEGRKREFLADPKYLAYKGCPLCRTPSRRNSGTVPDIPRQTETALSFIIPISARSPATGCRGCRRQRRNTAFRSKQSILPTGTLRRMSPRRSRPMPCSGMGSF